MAKATVKSAEVDVRQYAGPGTFTIMNDLKGELHAKKGDWLIGTEKGKIDVLSDAEFKAKYDLTEDLTDQDQEPVPVVNAPVDPVAGAAPVATVRPTAVPVSPAASSTIVSAPEKVTGSVIEAAGTETLTLKSDSTVMLAKGGTLPVSEVFTGAVLSGGWVIEHIDAAGDETTLTLKK